MIRWAGVRLFIFLLILSSFASCTTETSFYSENTLSNDFALATERNFSPERISYSSTISNLVSTFPKFKNVAVNNQVAELKQNLTNYLYAIQSSNEKEKKKSFKQFEDSYKNIQRLRKYLKSDDDQVLNRYLVNLKTNVSLLEAVEKNESKNIISTK
ncbi:hypothetical protein [Chryseobacterium sp. POL2]|uniref:hypothetical protein n=1 Tax=Chryseobacterium sp. POL2 TaxID=2713414 RepID=UPI0013E1F0F6|nr:hypothetical protein [Chryseobacterium sp. POL2]QIG89772.1 hypothetical protein G6R40_08885 [Chryseobacterium sp. POL2]